MDISICFADFPTEAIAETTRDYRQLGIGYANLGALLMATGPRLRLRRRPGAGRGDHLADDRTAYRRSAELPAMVGPYDGYARNADAAQAGHAQAPAANDDVTVRWRDAECDPQAGHARRGTGVASSGETNGYRNAQASVLAPTGCLTADTLVTTDRGLARLGELGDVWGDRWQDLDAQVSTDEGPRQATKFFVNGEEPTRRIVTEGGYTIQGTLAHRIKVVDAETGHWVWKRMADIAPDDLVPMQLGTLVGEPRRVPLPVLDQAYYAGDRGPQVPDAVTRSWPSWSATSWATAACTPRASGCVSPTPTWTWSSGCGSWPRSCSVWSRRRHQSEGYQEVQAAPRCGWPGGGRPPGFAKALPEPTTPARAGRHGCRRRSWRPTTPRSTRRSCAVCSRPTARSRMACRRCRPPRETFAAEVRTLLLAARPGDDHAGDRSGWGGPILQVRLRNIDHALRFDERVGFLGERKNELVRRAGADPGWQPGPDPPSATGVGRARPGRAVPAQRRAARRCARRAGAAADRRAAVPETRDSRLGARARLPVRARWPATKTAASSRRTTSRCRTT